MSVIGRDPPSFARLLVLSQRRFDAQGRIPPAARPASRERTAPTIAAPADRRPCPCGERLR